MNKKFKLIFMQGGLGWGVPFCLLISVLRWIENRPPAFGSYVIFLIVSVIGGIVCGYIMYKSAAKKERTDFSFLTWLKSIVLVAVIMCIYGLIFRYWLAPNDLGHTLWSTGAFICMTLVGIFIQHKFILRNSTV